MNKTLKHIKEHTYPIYADTVKKVVLNKNGSIDLVYCLDGMEWKGALQGVELDKNGETVGYKVYVY